MPFTAKGIKKLAAHHNMDPDVNSDDDIENCLRNSMKESDIQDLANRAEAGDRAVDELATVLANQAETDLKTYANRIGDSDESKDFWRAQLIENREGALKAIEKLPASAAVAAPAKPGVRAPLHNRETAGTPKTVENGGKEKAEVRHAQGIRNRAHTIQDEARRNNRRVDFNTAFRMAQAEAAAAAE